MRSDQLGDSFYLVCMNPVQKFQFLSFLEELIDSPLPPSLDSEEKSKERRAMAARLYAVLVAARYNKADR